VCAWIVKLSPRQAIRVNGQNQAAIGEQDGEVHQPSADHHAAAEDDDQQGRK
jgi:hypothetical protein